MLTRGLFYSIYLCILFQIVKCEKVECPRAEFITSGVDINEITGEWFSKQVITLEGKPDDTIIESEDCLGIKIENQEDGRLKFVFHAANLNTSNTDTNVNYRTFFTVTKSEENGFKAEVLPNITEVTNDDIDEPDFYIYIMSAVADKYLILMQCETVGSMTHVTAATIFSRRTTDSKPAIMDEELSQLSQLVLEKTRAQVHKRLNFKLDCFNNERNYDW